jgi:hypothetical protein
MAEQLLQPAPAVARQVEEGTRPVGEPGHVLLLGVDVPPPGVVPLEAGLPPFLGHRDHALVQVEREGPRPVVEGDDGVAGAMMRLGGTRERA